VEEVFYDVFLLQWNSINYSSWCEGKKAAAKEGANV